MEPLVVKLSGAVADSPEALQKVCSFVAKHWKKEDSVVLIHGGGKSINTLCSKLDIPIRQVEGRRITDPEILNVLLYTVGGQLNKQLVSALRSQGVPAVGLTGVDGQLTTAIRRPPWTVQGKVIDFGLVGDIQAVDEHLLRLLLKDRFIPVLGCLTWSEKEGLLNVNADTFACRMAQALPAREWIILMEVPAVLDAEKRPLSVLKEEDFQAGRQTGWISDGMIPKLEMGFEALRTGIPSVRLTHPDGLLSGGGTRLAL